MTDNRRQRTEDRGHNFEFGMLNSVGYGCRTTVERDRVGGERTHLKEEIYETDLRCGVVCGLNLRALVDNGIWRGENC